MHLSVTGSWRMTRCTCCNVVAGSLLYRIPHTHTYTGRTFNKIGWEKEKYFPAYFSRLTPTPFFFKECSCRGQSLRHRAAQVNAEEVSGKTIDLIVVTTERSVFFPGFGLDRSVLSTYSDQPLNNAILMAGLILLVRELRTIKWSLGGTWCWYVPCLSCRLCRRQGYSCGGTLTTFLGPANEANTRTEQRWPVIRPPAAYLVSCWFTED